MTGRDGAALNCPQCGRRYTTAAACGWTHAVMASEIKRAPYLASLVVRERERAARVRRDTLNEAIDVIEGDNTWSNWTATYRALNRLTQLLRVLRDEVES